MTNKKKTEVKIYKSMTFNIKFMMKKKKINKIN